jgi:hypothetical protein
MNIEHTATAMVPMPSAQPELRHRVWKAAGNLSLVFVPSLVLCVIYVGFRYVLPARQQLLGLTAATWLAHVLPGCWCVLCFGYNWVSCVVANPGCTSSALYIQLVAESISAGVLPQRLASTDLHSHHERWSGAQLQQVATELQEWGRQAGVSEQFVWAVCHKSGKLKPPLAHFCRVRGTLVLNYDHYCPWVANTIGLGNYRHFLLTAVHFALGCLYCVAEVMPVVFAGFRDHQRRTGPWRMWDVSETGEELTAASTAALSTFGLYGLLSLASAALLAGLLVGSFGVWHLLNLAAAATTVNVARVREPVVALESACTGPGRRHCNEWWQRECGCGVGGGEFAVAYENGVESVSGIGLRKPNRQHSSHPPDLCHGVPAGIVIPRLDAQLGAANGGHARRPALEFDPGLD